MERPLGGRDPLLQLTHLVGQRGLVTHGRRHATEQRGHLGACLDEAEDVVDEEQHVLVLHVTEVLGHGQRRQGDAQPDPRWLVHLTEHESGLLEHARLGHLDHQVGALTGALTDSGEHRHATVVLRHATDHLGDQHGLADAGTTEQADLSTGDVRGEQVDDLDAGLEQPLRWARGRRSRGQRRWISHRSMSANVGVVTVEHVAPHVPHVAERAVADRHTDAVADVAHRGATGEAVGGLHAHGAHPAVTELLGDLGEDLDVLAFDRDGELQRAVELGQRAAGELDVDHRSGDGDDATVLALVRGGGFRDGHQLTLSGWGSKPVYTRLTSMCLALSPPSASAPETISMISVVIAS